MKNSAPLIGIKKPPKPKILVVDDEKSNVQLLARYLGAEGYEILTAFNGKEALEQVYSSAPDVVLLDVMMPVMDGLTLCRRLRSDVLTRSLPVIFLTARNSLDDRLLGLQAGVDDYIGKPFDLEEVKARLQSTLQRRRWDLASHPLTHLPGSPMIEEEVWKRLREGKTFAFAYIDIDHFKAYNDVYGYEAGDKVIKYLSTQLIEATKEASVIETFAGHVGGDDFVLLSSWDYTHSALSKIANNFDLYRDTFYHKKDLKRGYLQTKNRQNQINNFPLMSLSIAVISNATRRILHYAQLVEIASELKKYIKEQNRPGKSLIQWDRRTDPVKENSHE